jgi:hypothetical protein
VRTSTAPPELSQELAQGEAKLELSQELAEVWMEVGILLETIFARSSSGGGYNPRRYELL